MPEALGTRPVDFGNSPCEPTVDGAVSVAVASARRASHRTQLFERVDHIDPPNLALRGIRNIENLLLLFDDDLRETAIAMARIEQYLIHTMAVIDSPQVTATDIASMAADTTVLEHLDQLNCTLEGLRSRLFTMARNMRYSMLDER